jgi:hypothetical protein
MIPQEGKRTQDQVAKDGLCADDPLWNVASLRLSRIF